VKKGETEKIGSTKGEGKDKDFQGPGVEGEKSPGSNPEAPKEEAPEAPSTSEMVTGEDVIKRLREKGKKI
jgi:hypothetical protein